MSDTPKYSELTRAIRYESRETIKALIAGGADVNGRDSDGSTSLHYAIRDGRRKVVALLIEAGADVNAVDGKFGLTPLHHTSDHKKPDILQALIRAGADLNAKGESIFTAWEWILHTKIEEAKLDAFFDDSWS